MSEERISRVSVRLLDREYQVACPVEERSDLLDSAEYLDGKMREIRDSGKVVGLDRIAVIAALNIANELIKQRKHGTVRRGRPRRAPEARCASAWSPRSRRVSNWNSEGSQQSEPSTIWRRLRCSTRSGLPLDRMLNTLGSLVSRQHCASPPRAESLKCRGLPQILLLSRAMARDGTGGWRLPFPRMTAPRSAQAPARAAPRSPARRTRARPTARSGASSRRLRVWRPGVASPSSSAWPAKSTCVRASPTAWRRGVRLYVPRILSLRRGAMAFVPLTSGDARSSRNWFGIDEPVVPLGRRSELRCSSTRSSFRWSASTRRATGSAWAPASTIAPCAGAAIARAAVPSSAAGRRRLLGPAGRAHRTGALGRRARPGRDRARRRSLPIPASSHPESTDP